MHNRLTSLLSSIDLKSRARHLWPVVLAVILGGLLFGQGDRWIVLVVVKLPRAITALAEMLSILVQPVFLLPSCLLLSVAASIRPCDIKLSRFGFFGFNCASAALVAALVLKHAVGRARPDPALDFDPLVFHPLALHDAYASFPSAQSASAAAVAISAALIFPRLRYPLHGAALCVCGARVVTAEHWVTDVVVGWILGWMAVVFLSPLVLPAEKQDLG